MLDRVVEITDGPARPVTVVAMGAYDGWLGGVAAATQTWLTETGFQAKPGAGALLPGDAGGVAGALAVVDDEPDLWSFAGLPGALAPGAGRRRRVGWRARDQRGAGLDARLLSLRSLSRT